MDQYSNNMKISFSKNFTSLSIIELDFYLKKDFVPIVMIPNLEMSNPDLEFDVRDIFFVPSNVIKKFNPETDKKYCYMFPPSSYSDVILTDKAYGEQLWNRYSQYNPSESYKDISKVLNFSIIFKVLSPAMVDNVQSIINKEYLDLRGTINIINNFKGM